MAITVDKVIVTLEAKIAAYQANVRQAESQFTKAMGTIEKSAQATRNTLNNVFKLAGVSVGVAGALALGKAFIGVADASKQLNAQLKLATAQSGSYAKAQEDVRDIAVATRSDVESVAKLYGNFMRNARDLGISQEDAARATKTVASAFIISGAGADEASNAIRQLIQGLQSGVLRGDEFNSMMENAPRLAKLLADSLGVPIGALRKMAEAGQLTADKLTKALTDARFTDALDAELKQIPVTFDQAMAQVHNAAIATFGAFDQGGEFSTMISNFVTGGAEDFKDLEKAAEELGMNVRATIEGLGSAFEPFAEAAKAAFESAGFSLEKFSMDGQKQISDLLTIADQLLNIGPAIAEFFGATGNYRSHLAADFNARREEVKRDLKMNSQLRILAGAADKGGGDASTKVTPPGKTTKKKKASGPTAEEIAEKAAQDAAKIDIAILREKARQADTAEEVADFETAQLNRDVAAAIEANNADKHMTKAQKDALNARERELADIKFAGIEREKQARLIEEAADVQQGVIDRQKEALDHQLAMAKTEAERRAIQLQLLDLDIQQRDAALAKIQATGTPAQAALAGAARAGLAGEKAGKTSEIMKDTQGPFQDWLDSADDMNSALETIAVDGLEQLNSGITDAIMNFDNMGKVFQQVGKSIIAMLIQMIVKQMIFNALSAAFSAFGGGGSISSFGGGAGTNKTIAGIGASFKAGGGPVLGGKPYVVGENGPEMFVPQSAGRIIPNGQMAANDRGGRAPVVQVHVTSGEMFDARVARISGEVSVAVVQQTAPTLINGAVAETSRQMSRSRM